MQKFLFPVLALALFSSCQKDEPEDAIVVIAQKSYANVDAALWSYYQEFEEQAAARGIEIDLEAFGVTGEIHELSPDGVAGQCTYGSHIADVVIDKSFWENVPSLNVREMVVFHELGHCYLHRGHEESILSNGACASIMRSGLEDCQDNYNSQTKAAYLDELFSVANP